MLVNVLVWWNRRGQGTQEVRISAAVLPIISPSQGFLIGIPIRSPILTKSAKDSAPIFRMSWLR
jgi:hypothetical protein